jgi:hypothetical protein
VTPESASKFRCWSATSIAETIFSDIGALAGDADALFLAAHTPMELEHRRGRELGLGGSGEFRVLEALTSRIGDTERNTLVAVTGASGSGKSHVVRWVKAHLPSDDPRFRVLYVPRAVQTLRDLLRKIIEGLPGVQGTELMTRVDSAISGVKPGELQARIFADMKIALDWTIEERGPHEGETTEEAEAREDRNSLLGTRDPDVGRREGLSELLDIAAFRESLLRPDGSLGQLVQSYFSETSRRDTNDEIFTRDDLPINARGILTELRGRDGLRELWQIISRNPGDAINLLEEALRAALPRAVGLRAAGGDTLDSLFRESRKALRAKGQELVLIFEDLAQFGLVDGELYDQFVTQPGEDLAPLRVIFAVTDGPYDRMERTVRTRIEHEFHVGGSALASPSAFVGRYLNLVRVGRKETQQLWDSRTGADGELGWMSNACDTFENGRPCSRRETCHPAFGAVQVEGLGEVGLYPFNEVALRRAIAHIGEAATPRDVLDHCFSTILAEADVHIGKADYPHARTQDQFDFKVRNSKEAVLASNPSSDPDRNYRALVIWGDESALPQGMLNAFSLDGKAVESKDRKPQERVLPKSELENKLQALFQWQVGGQLPEDDVVTIRTTLCGLTIDRLRLDQACIHIYSGHGKEILDKLFNMTSFEIEDARGRLAGPQSVRFKLTRSDEDVRVMAAARWFRDHGHFDPTQAKWLWPQGYEPNQLMVDLEARLDSWADHVRGRFLAETGGSRLAQQAVGLRAVALAASGHGVPSTTASVLSEPGQAALAPSGTWGPVDETAARILSRIRVNDYVGEFAAVRQGERGGPQLVDPRGIEEAIARFRAQPAKALKEVSESQADPVLSQAAAELLRALTSASPSEVELLAKSAENVRVLLEGRSPKDVADAAFAVGDSAKDAGFFRPLGKWEAFRSHIDKIARSERSDSRLPTADDLRQVLFEQRAIRETALLSESLAFVREAMELTRNECRRSGGAAGDVSTLQRTVKGQLAEITRLVETLGRQD